MPRLVALLRTVVGYLVFFTLVAFPASLHLYARWLFDLIRALPSTRRRQRVDEWRAWWGSATVRVMALFLGVKIEFHALQDSLREGEPAIIIANHRKHLDIIILIAYARSLGLSHVRWVLKEELKWRSGFIGHSCIMSACAFVGRKGKRDMDVERITEAARITGTDSACMLIFPEGTRFTASRKKPPFEHVLWPKQAGFQAIREALPQYPVISVTLHWQDRDGRELFDSHKTVGTKLLVTARRYAPEQVAAPEWLTQEWQRKDKELSV